MPTIDDLAPHRPALLGHCYRMLGSLADADDAVQETLLRAWRALESFEERSQPRTWLWRIATNVCLDQLSQRERRARSIELGPPGSLDAPLEALPAERFVEPIPDAWIVPEGASPERAAELRRDVRLAFVAALQHLPPRQRAALLLVELVGFSAAEAADVLEASVASTNSALQRARATLAEAQKSERTVDAPLALSADQETLVARYVEAFERYDVDALVSLLRDDVVFSMPPYTLWFEGAANVARWLRGRGHGCTGSVLRATTASGWPAFGQYRLASAFPETDPRRPTDPSARYGAWGLVVLELDAARVVRWTTFLDTPALFPRFGLPLTLP